MIENTELNEVMDKLENLEDEQLAVKLLAEFNSKTAILGKLLLNQDPDLSHDEWKIECDKAQTSVNEVVRRIHEA